MSELELSQTELFYRSYNISNILCQWYFGNGKIHSLMENVNMNILFHHRVNRLIFWVLVKLKMNKIASVNGLVPEEIRPVPEPVSTVFPDDIWRHARWISSQTWGEYNFAQQGNSYHNLWWRHDIETSPARLALWERNISVIGWFPSRHKGRITPTMM